MLFFTRDLCEVVLTAGVYWRVLIMWIVNFGELNYGMYQGYDVDTINILVSELPYASTMENNKGICLYRVLLSIGRNVRGRTDYTCVQLHIPFTWVNFSLFHIFVGHANVYFYEWLTVNPFSCTLVRFTIVILNWYASVSYSIVLTI